MDRLRPCGIDLPRRIQARLQALVTEGVLELNQFGRFDDFPGQMSGYECDTLPQPQNHIARHHGSATDDDGGVVTDDHRLIVRAGSGGIPVPVEDDEIIKLEHAGQIAGPAPDDGSRARPVVDHVCQIVTDKAATNLLVEQVRDDDVTGDKPIHDPVLVPPLQAQSFCRFVDNIGQIRTMWDEIARHRSAYENRIRMCDFPLALKLAVVTVCSQYGPGLLAGHPAHALQD